VPRGQETALASGPTLPDAFSVLDVHRVLDSYGLRDSLPLSLSRWIDSGSIPETPKAGDPGFANAHFCVLLGLDDLFHPAHHAAEAQGCITCCDNVTDNWPVEKAADYLLRQLGALRAANPHRRVALIADGELSSPVLGDGQGGRNSAFVLACVEEIAGKRVAVLSAGTDGIDGNSPAAGAVADGDTMARARALGLDSAAAFQSSAAYSFFAKLNDAIITGPTGTNLRDLRLLIAEPEVPRAP
jgi:hydroxypyruvate reductase